MGNISLVIPQLGVPDTSEDVKVQNAFTTIQTVINGNIDSTNLSAVTAQSATVNQSGQTVKGAVSIATSQSTASPTFTTLATPDQITGLAVPTNGILMVAYSAQWSCTASSAGTAAVHIGSNQLEGLNTAGTAQSFQVATSSATAGAVSLLGTTSMGLLSLSPSSSYSGDVTTGQVLSPLAPGTSGSSGGPTYIWGLPAGTYTVSVKFAASSGTTTVLNRHLWAWVLSFT